MGVDSGDILHLSLESDFAFVFRDRFVNYRYSQIGNRIKYIHIAFKAFWVHITLCSKIVKASFVHGEG